MRHRVADCMLKRGMAPELGWLLDSTNQAHRHDFEGWAPPSNYRQKS